LPKESKYEMMPVGRIFVTAKKKKSPRAWPRLLKEKKKPKNMSVWWDMQEKYSDEISRLEESS
jgi:hypothetical protein